MVPFIVFIAFAVLLSFSNVDCGYTSSNTGSHSASDGTGGSYSQSNNNGQGTYANTNQQPGGGFTTQSGVGNPYVPGYYGPANLYQNAFGATYSPGYGYNNNYNPHYNSNPVYNPYPAQQYSGFGSPFVPFAPVPSPIEFNQYLNSLQQQYYHGGTFAQTTPGATAFANSYLGPTKFFKQQLDYANAIKNVQAHAFPIPAQDSAYGPNYAYATGAYGPNGIHQSAGVFPGNKYKPNIDVNNRFNPDDNDVTNPSGQFYGVSTTSFSNSADVNGIKTHKEGAIATVNDNGKVTTYKVDN